MVEPWFVDFNFWDLATTLLGLNSSFFPVDSAVGMLIYTAGLFFIVYMLIYIVHVFTRLLMSILTVGRYRE